MRLSALRPIAKSYLLIYDMIRFYAQSFICEPIRTYAVISILVVVVSLAFACKLLSYMYYDML